MNHCFTRSWWAGEIFCGAFTLSLASWWIEQLSWQSVREQRLIARSGSMTDPLTVLSAVAASTQVAEQLFKNCFLIVKEILRARKDLKEAPEKTEDLFKQVEFVDLALKMLATFTPKENEPTELVVGLREESGSEFLKAVIEDLHTTLCSVREKVEEFQAKDKNREGKNKRVETGKNLFHRGGTKQKKEAEELRGNLAESLKKLITCLGVVAHTKTGDTHVLVGATHDLVRETSDHVLQMHKGIADLGQQLEQIKMATDFYSFDEKLHRGEEHVKSATAEFQIDNDMVKNLINAADYDLENDSYPVAIEWKTARVNAVWSYLEGEFAGDAGVGEVRRQRASVVTGWPVYDWAPHGASVRFTMSVPDRRFFYFLSYAHKAGAELELFFPKRNNVKNIIQKEDSERVFPARSQKYPRDPRNWALKKESGSSKSSTESVFLIFSKETLVRAEAQSKKGDWEILDVAGELKKHLEKKNDDVYGYDDIIVKHVLFDIRVEE